jgi:hypothetical protein
MTSRDFAYWLQGLFELSDVTTLNEKQLILSRWLNSIARIKFFTTTKHNTLTLLIYPNNS